MTLLFRYAAAGTADTTAFTQTEEFKQHTPLRMRYHALWCHGGTKAAHQHLQHNMHTALTSS